MVPVTSPESSPLIYAQALATQAIRAVHNEKQSCSQTLGSENRLWMPNLRWQCPICDGDAQFATVMSNSRWWCLIWQIFATMIPNKGAVIKHHQKKSSVLSLTTALQTFNEWIKIMNNHVFLRARPILRDQSAKVHGQTEFPKAKMRSTLFKNLKSGKGRVGYRNQLP